MCWRFASISSFKTHTFGVQGDALNQEGRISPVQMIMIMTVTTVISMIMIKLWVSDNSSDFCLRFRAIVTIITAARCKAVTQAKNHCSLAIDMQCSRAEFVCMARSSSRQGS